MEAKMSIAVKLMLIAVLGIPNARAITVRNGAYHNIAIEIERDVPQSSDCSNYLLSLEVRLFELNSDVNILGGIMKTTQE